MQFRQQPVSAAAQQGVLMVEAMIAILIFSMGILGLIGLQGTMTKNTTDAKYRSEANYIVQQELGKLWADPCNLDNYSGTDLDISDRLPNGKLTISHSYSGSIPKASCVPAQLKDQTTIIVSWQLPGETSPHRVTNTSSITGG